MAGAIQIDQLADAVIKEMQEYADITNDNVKKAVRKAANATKNRIAATAPERTGAYKKSFIVTKKEERADKLVVVVHSKKHYRLTHLLEDGHALRQGGRTKAYPHIKPAEEYGIELFESLVKKSLGGK